MMREGEATRFEGRGGGGGGGRGGREDDIIYLLYIIYYSYYYHFLLRLTQRHFFNEFLNTYTVFSNSFDILVLS